MMPMMLLRPGGREAKDNRVKKESEDVDESLRRHDEEPTMTIGSTADSAILLLTCGYEENACTEEDVVCLVVDSADADTQPAEHQQASAEDGEHTGGPNYTCRDVGKRTRQGDHLITEKWLYWDSF